MRGSHRGDWLARHATVVLLAWGLATGTHQYYAGLAVRQLAVREEHITCWSTVTGDLRKRWSAQRGREIHGKDGLAEPLQKAPLELPLTRTALLLLLNPSHRRIV